MKGCPACEAGQRLSPEEAAIAGASLGAALRENIGELGWCPKHRSDLDASMCALLDSVKARLEES